MCAPVMPLLGVGLSIGSAMAGMGQAQQNANNQNAMWMSNEKAAVAAQSNRYDSLNANLNQEKAAADQDLMQSNLKAIRAEATARVAAGQSGVTGLSTNAVLSDYLTRQGQQAESIDVNYETKVDQTTGELVATNDQAIGRINGMSRAAPVSALPFVFQALGGSMKSIATGDAYASGGGTGQVDFGATG